MVIKKQGWESYNLPDVLNVKLPVSLTIGCSGKNKFCNIWKATNCPFLVEE